jgi:hypothetical protein
MTLRWLAAIAGLFAVTLAGPVAAQVPMMGNLPTFDSAPPAPPPGAAPPPMAAPPPGAQGRPGPGQEPPTCIRDFVPLRDEAQKRGNLIQAAATRKAPRQEVCQLFKNFEASEAKVVKFVTANQAQCQIPQEAVTTLKTNHDRTIKTRTQICADGPMGAAPGAPPPGPKLSDELGVRGVAGPNTGSAGSGTFNTLTGNALSR